MRFEGGLVSEQMIEGAVETILVDLLIAELQQIAQRCATVPSPRQCATRSTARRTAPQLEPPPSWPMQCAPFQSAAVARTDPQAPFRATAQAQDTRHQTDASARCECLSAALAPSDVRCRHQTTALARDCRSADAQALVPQRVHARRVRQDAPLFAG